MSSSSEMRRINLSAVSLSHPQQPDGKLFILTERQGAPLQDGSLKRASTLEVLDAGTVFGEVAFTPQAFRESDAEAMEPSSVFAMERAEVERLFFRSPR